ncbi:MAG TPA: tetratricopeptide repeat protein [Holophagaceae bacterium]|nr:tetratricopeptide repeat protein [Holophagaceae bacterium]
MIPLPPVLIQSAALGAKDFTARCGELSRAKDWPGLEALARTQMAADPKDAAAQAALGFALLAQNKTGEGKAACEAALQLDPKRADALYYLGIAYAQAGDAAGVAEVGRRVGTVSTDALQTYWQIPVIEDAVLGHPELPIFQASVLHFESMSMDSVKEAAGPYTGPLVVALTVDADGRPMSAHSLLAPAGVVMPLELAAMRWLVEPVKVDGKPVAGRFVKVVTMDATTKSDAMRTVRVGR